MSVESATEYLRRLFTDRDFLATVKEARGAEERRAAIAAAGNDFTLEELAEARSLELSDEKSRELALSADELAEIVGGSGCGFTHESEHCLTRGGCTPLLCAEACQKGGPQCASFDLPLG